MITRVDELVREVRIAIDLNEEGGTLLASGDTDTLTLDDIIRSKIEQGARAVEQSAPVWLLDSGKPLAGSITFREEVGKGRGRMQLPDDFMRLVTFKMSDWERAVTEAIAESDPRYLQQSSRFAGLRGCPQKPVVAIVSEPTGLVLEFWSCVGGEDVVLQRGRYLPFPKIRGEGIEICEKLREAVVLYIGYLTLLTVGDRERAQSLLEQSREMSGLV